MENLIKELVRIQKTLKAPKNQWNSFGKYKYRNCEDILEAVKPLLPDNIVTYVTDDIVLIGDRYYVKGFAIFTDGVNKIESNGFARESLTKKGMDDSQITGTASSYARKYALNGLFNIDDSKDVDTDEHQTQTKVVEIHPDLLLAVQEASSHDELKSIWEAHKTVKGLGAIITKRKNEIA